MEYDGAAYRGWQRQAGFPTIQQKLEEAVERATGEEADVQGSGRTDTGVHALRQVAHFRTSSRLPDATLLRAINSFLPRDIGVLRCETAPSRFHAQFDAVSKRYLYLVRSSRVAHPIGRRCCYWVPYPLSVAKMRRAARAFLGAQDFRSFANVEKNARTTRRRVYSFKILRSKEFFLFVVEGDGFLLHMVRTMVGTLIEVGRGKIPPARVASILKARDRKKAGPTAPAWGLYLLRVKYRSPSRRPRRKRQRELVE